MRGGSSTAPTTPHRRRHRGVPNGRASLCRRRRLPLLPALPRWYRWGGGIPTPAAARGGGVGTLEFPPLPPPPPPPAAAATVGGGPRYLRPPPRWRCAPPRQRQRPQAPSPPPPTHSLPQLCRRSSTLSLPLHPRAAFPLPRVLPPPAPCRHLGGASPPPPRFPTTARSGLPNSPRLSAGARGTRRRPGRAEREIPVGSSRVAHLPTLGRLPLLVPNFFFSAPWAHVRPHPPLPVG